MHIGLQNHMHASLAATQQTVLRGKIHAAKQQQYSQIMAAVSAVSMPNMNRAGNLAKVAGLAMPPAMVLVTWPPRVMAPCRNAQQVGCW